MKQQITYTTIYPRNWQRVSAIIRRLAGGRCEWCQCATDRLSVHHIGAPFPDGRPGNPRDKRDLRRENLVAICFNCHEEVDHIKQVRKRKQAKLRRRMARIARHRALGIGTSLVVCEVKHV
jgi:hypothetical protein